MLKTEASFRDPSSISLKYSLNHEIIAVSAESHRMSTRSLTFQSFPSKSSQDSVKIPDESVCGPEIRHCVLLLIF